MRRLTLTLLLIAAGLGTAHAAESNVTIVSGLDLGFKKLRLDTGSGAGVFNPFFVTLNPSIVLGYSSFYASLSYDKSVSADPDVGQNAAGSTVSVTDYSRTDSTFTLGYRLNRSFSLFAGYAEGVNKIITKVLGGGFIVTDYTEKGPFAGVAYTKTFGDKGSLGMSIGYAKLDGDLDLRIDIPPVVSGARVKGDVTGLSYGLTWSGPLTGSLSYRVGLKAIRYEMKDPADVTERYTNFFIGIMNYF